MFRTILLTGALAIGAPALAQTMPPSGTTSATPQTMPAPAQPVPATPGLPAAPYRPATGSGIAAIVDSEFPAYDTSGDGQLDQAEFSRWMLALKDQEMKATGSQLPADQVTAWANGAFTTADTDKSITISKSELIAFLGGGAA